MSPGVYTQFRDLGLPKRPVIVRPPVNEDSGPPPPPPAPPIVQDGLLFYLDAGNASSYPGSGTTMTDLSGNGYNGILTNGPTYDSGNGGTIVLDGSNDYINVTGLDLRRNFSLEIWVKFDIAARTNGLFFQGINDTNQSINVRQETTTTEFSMYNNDYGVSFTATSDVWYHYVVTYNHSSPYTKKIYRNGVLIGASGTQGQYAGTGNLLIGSTMDGNMAIVRAYSKILSTSEIEQNFNAQKSRFGYGEPQPLISLDAGNISSYPGSGTTWFNLAGNSAYDATLNNGITYDSGNGGSFLFDGNDDFVSLIAPSIGSTSFTWNFWVKVNNLSTQSLLFSGNGSNASHYGVIGLNPDSLGLTYYAFGYQITDGVAFGTDWTYISLVATVASMRLYRNGVQAGGTYNVGFYNIVSTTPYIGRNHSYPPENMKGYVSTVTFYNQALTDGQILQDFNSTKARYGY